MLTNGGTNSDALLLYAHNAHQLLSVKQRTHMLELCVAALNELEKMGRAAHVFELGALTESCGQSDHAGRRR